VGWCGAGAFGDDRALAVVLITVALSQVDRRIDLAARSMGAGLATRIFQVILPNIRFVLIGASS
jgi:putative spermidine/putrescine transport system permease protein